MATFLDTTKQRLWFVKKQELQQGSEVYCKIRQVWWCHVGQNIGSEQNGKGSESLRPVIIMRVFSKKYFLGIPETSKKREGSYFFEIKHGVDNNLSSFALLNQIRVYSTKRLKKKIANIEQDTFRNLKDALIKILELQVNTLPEAGSEPPKR